MVIDFDLFVSKNFRSWSGASHLVSAMVPRGSPRSENRSRDISLKSSIFFGQHLFTPEVLQGGSFSCKE